MAQFEKHFVQDLTQDIKIRQCGTIVFNGDNLSNVITVDLYNGTEPYSGGGTVAGACICPDGSTVPLTGSLSGNTASVTLTGGCFEFPGQIGIGVQVVIAGEGSTEEEIELNTIKTTVLKAIYNVELYETDNVVDPGGRITLSVGELVNRIDQATAEIPASDMASLMAGIAPTFSASTNYAAGAYVYYNGTLYRFTTAHAAGSWTGTDATAVVLANDVADLKSALTKLINEGSVSATGQGIKYLSYSVISGKTYHLSANTASNVSVATVDSAGNVIEDIGNISIATGIVDFTASQNAPRVLFYFRGAGVATIEEAGLVLDDLNDINNSLSPLEQNITETRTLVNTLYYARYLTANSTNWIDSFNITAGKTFKIINNTTEKVVVGFYASDKSTSLQSDNEIPSNSTGYVTADYNSAYILVYSRNGATGTITVEDMELIVPEIENYLRPVETINVTGVNTYWLNLPVKAGETYKIFNGSNSYISIGTYANDKTTRVEELGQTLSGETKTFTANSNAYYLLIYCPASATIGKIIIYENTTINAKLVELDQKINTPVTVGTNGDYQTVKDGITVAFAQNRDLLILPGVYDLVEEGISGTGYMCPKRVYGYGAILQCHLANEDWSLSPLNIYPYKGGTEIYGLTIDASNCRYCVHDEMGSNDITQHYHNVYKDCHFIHNSNPSETLLAPQCIGGGLGDEGYIEISNCIFDAKIRDVTYHSEVAQSGKCDIKISNCYFSHKPTIADVTGGPNTVVNKMYVSNCLLGEAIENETKISIQLIEWNNVVRN